MKNLSLLFLITCFFSCSNKKIDKNDNPNFTIDPQKSIQNFIKVIKKQDYKKLSELIVFPLKRENPLPDVGNKAAFLERYEDIFDEQLRQEIIQSDPNKDWSVVGSRGIMLNSGTLWLNPSGKLIAVNYQSEAEKEQKEALLAMGKQDLHASLQDFEKPVLVLETEEFRVRIDDLGNRNYRYAAWKVHTQMTSEPDLIITNGKYIPEGSGGNHRYVFPNGQYRYECFIIVLGANDSPPAILSVYQKGEPILEQNAVTLQH